nr:biotin-dependent carboxyltransferase family protein [Devosia oryzisoli]
MTARVLFERAGPLTTIQDAGRFGYLGAGISASGPMDQRAYRRAGVWAGATGGGGLEFTQAGLDLVVAEGACDAGWDGGDFVLAVNDRLLDWPGSAHLQEGDRLSIRPGAHGNYGYLRFGGRIDVPEALGSQSTSTRARLGGLEGRALRTGDVLTVSGEGKGRRPASVVPMEAGDVRFIWGIHADFFAGDLRVRFNGAPFRITRTLDRMGVRLQDESKVFEGASILSLVSEPVLPGDIQILGDGTPIVLMRDHQPTGGYPRIGTIIAADLDRFAQMRPGTPVVFAPVTVDHAHQLLRRAAP